MNLAAIISLMAVLLAGCAAAQKSPVPIRTMTSKAVVAPQNPFPLIIPDPITKTNCAIVWPDESVRANYVWLFEVASNLPGPWWTADQDCGGTNATVRLHGASFIRLVGKN